MSKQPPFGLGASAPSGELLFLPLHSVSVNALIFDVSALVELKQQYTNPPRNGNLTAARYIFPIPGNAAVCAFKMEDSDGRILAGVVKETEKAKKDFEKAVSKGKWSGLAYEITGDVFSISIGAIPPGKNVEISLSYSMDIPENESEKMNQIRFALPTFIGRRYGNAPAELSQPRSEDRGATFTFNASVRLTSKILEITSPSHGTDIVVQESQRLQGGSAPLYGTDVKLREPFPLDKEFVLSIQAETLDMPRCIAEVNTAEDTVALMLTLVPRLGAPDVDSQEYIFVVDRSGSMTSESRIDYAKDALKHLMKGLPSKNTFFNIVSFGNQHSSLWTKSVIYNRENLSAAIAHIGTMSANMGGTEIGNALDWAFSSRVRHKPTAVFVLTDGEIWQPDAVISSVGEKVKNSGSTDFLRVFTIGIGNGASVALCSGLARVGNGVCFMTTRSEEIKDRCSKVLRAARTLPYGNTCNLTVDWGYDTVPHTPPKPQDKAAAVVPETKKKPIDFFDRSINPFEKTKDIGLQFELPPPPDVLQAPTQPPNFYPGNRFLVSAILANTLEPPAKVVLKGTLPGGEPVEIPVKVAYVLGDQKRLPLLHTLAAKRFIRELEDGDIRALGIPDKGDRSLRNDIVKAAVVDYGVRYSLASRFTAFIATEKVGEEFKDEGVKEDEKDKNLEMDLDKGEESESDDTWDEVSERAIDEDDSDEDMGCSLFDDVSCPPPVPGRSAGRPAAPPPPPPGQFTPRSRRDFAAPAAAVDTMAAMRFAAPAPPPRPRVGGKSPRVQLAPSVPASTGMASPVTLNMSVRSSGASVPAPPPPPASPAMKRKKTTSNPFRSSSAGVIAANDPISEVADIQSHDGSFALNGQLLALLRRQKELLTLDSLKRAIPESIRKTKDAETVWGTVLVAAYMMVALADNRSVWDSLWDKAQGFVCQEMNIAPFQFNQLVQAASAELK